MNNKFWKGIIIGLIIVLPFWLWVGSKAFGADQADFPAVYIDADVGAGGVGSEVDPYDELSDVNWTTGGDNSIFDYLDGTPSESPTINLQKTDTWRETMTVGTSGTATYPIVIQSYGSGADPIISGADIITTWAAYTTATEIWNMETQEGVNWSDAAGEPDGRNYRVWIKNASISADALRIKIEMRAHSANNTVLSDMSIGIKATTGDAYDFASAPTNLQESGGDPMTIAAGVDEYTDEVDYILNSSVDHLVGLAHGGTDCRRNTDDGNHWYKDSGAGVDETETIDVTGFGNTHPRTVLSIESVPQNTWTSAVNPECEIVIMDDVVLTKGSAIHNLADHEWFWVGNVLYIRDDTGDPDGSGVVIEAGQRDYCIVASNIDYLTFDGLTVEAANGSHTFRFVGGSSHLTVENSTIRRSAGYGIFAGGTGTNITISNNTFSDMHNNGVIIEDVTTLSIIDNVFNTTYGANSQPLFLDTCTTWEVLRNTFTQLGTDSNKGNIHTDSGSGGTVKYNTFAYGNWGTDINDDDVVVSYNTFLDHTGETWSAAIYISRNGAAIDNHVYSHNIINGSTNAVLILDTGNDDNHTNFKFYNNSFYDSVTRAIYVTSPIGGEFKNNIIHGPSTTDELYRINQITGTWVSDYNLFRPEAVGFIYYVDTAYDTLAAYVAAKSQDANSINSDPLFTNAAGDDFTLQATSPCINAGYNLDVMDDGSGNTHHPICQKGSSRMGTNF